MIKITIIITLYYLYSCGASANANCNLSLKLNCFIIKSTLSNNRFRSASLFSLFSKLSSKKSTVSLALAMFVIESDACDRGMIGVDCNTVKLIKTDTTGRYICVKRFSGMFFNPLLCTRMFCMVCKRKSAINMIRGMFRSLVIVDMNGWQKILIYLRNVLYNSPSDSSCWQGMFYSI